VHESTVKPHVRRAGVTLRPLHKLDAQQIAEAARLYIEEGWSLSQLSERFGVDKKTVSRRLREAGVEIRKAGREQGFHPS
jgi:DNA-directed RNA polymerase specialized sigma24 family protein